MSKLEECILGDLVEFQRGYDLPKSKFVEGKYPVQSSNGILGYHNEYKVEGPGITIGRSGTVGTPHLIRENFFPHNTSLFVKEFKGNDIEYIYYLLQYLDLGNQKSGSGVPTMNRNHLHPIKIRAYRDKTYQQRTIKILSLIDKKIQINNQINQELEAMAKTLYDYWFEQFDFPDQNGKPYKSSGGKMVYNPELKREIPEGWGVEKLGDIETNIVTGKTPSRSIPENFGGDIPFITIGDIRGNTFIYSSAETLSDLGAEEQNKKYLPPNSLCVSCIATVGEIGFTTQLSQTNQQINSIIFNDVNHMYFLYFALKLFFESSKTKTGNTFANMSKDDFSKILIIYPDSSVIKNYYEKVKSMFDKIKCLQLQNQELTQLRDWLLPMLMNGQVKVEDKT